MITTPRGNSGDRAAVGRGLAARRRGRSRAGLLRPLGLASSAGALALGGLVALGAPATTPAATLAGAVCQDLGVAGQFNLFAGGNFSAQNGDIQGPLAAGGNVSLQHFTVDSANDPAVKGAELVAGGNLSFTNGSIGGNHVADYRGTVAETRVSPGSFQRVRAHEPFSFASTFSSLDQVSSSLAGAAQPSFDTVGQGPGGALKLTEASGGSGPNIFHVTASQLAAAKEVDLSVQAGSTVIIDVTGSAVDFSDLADVSVNGSESSATASELLWNFPSASAISYGSGGLSWLGSILAPRANLALGTGEFHGNVVAGGNVAYREGSEVHDQFFDGCLPPPPTTNTPVGSVGGATLAGVLALAGGTLLLVDRRRRGPARASGPAA
jgi:choice-of-anchor A domain-containing protein